MKGASASPSQKRAETSAATGWWNLLFRRRRPGLARGSPSVFPPGSLDVRLPGGDPNESRIVESILWQLGSPGGGFFFIEDKVIHFGIPLAVGAQPAGAGGGYGGGPNPMFPV